MDYVLQNLREALEVKTTPHDLRWDDPHFGEMQLRIDRQGAEVEVSIRSALFQTQETLKQHHHALAEELRLDPKQLRFDQGDSGHQESFRGRQGDSQQSSFQDRPRDSGPGTPRLAPGPGPTTQPSQLRDTAKSLIRHLDSSLDFIA